MVGSALDALREVFFVPEARGRLMLLTYETLASVPGRAMEAVYAHLGLLPFAHRFEDVRYDAEESDRRLGAPGLQRVGQRPAVPARDPVPPPGLITRFATDSFWHEASDPHGVAVV